MLRHVNRYRRLRQGGRPFRVEARLATPLIFGDYLTLDAILAYAVIREEMGAEYWDQGTLTPDVLMRPPVPLRRTLTRGETGNRTHVWHASAVLLPGPVAHGVDRLKKRWEDRPSCEKFVAYTGRGRIDEKAGPFKAWSVPVSTVSTPLVAWEACGDPHECLRLLGAYIPHLGKRRADGYGVVRSWSVQETDRDLSLFGADGACQRPIPVRRDRAGEWTLTEIRTYHPPYWLRQDARLCIAVGARRVDGREPGIGRQAP